MSSKKNVQKVKVFVRPRPLDRSDVNNSLNSVINCINGGQLHIKHGTVDKKYAFDWVFPELSTQESIYQKVVYPFVKYVINGYTCTVLAYGQTGTGKTHTISGEPVENLDFTENPQTGIIPRAAVHLFKELDSSHTDEYTVTISFIEIYNEEVRDLISLDENASPLRIFDDPEGKHSTIIRDVTEKTVCNARELYDWFECGQKTRQTAATRLNRASSRSHTVLIISVHTRQPTVDGNHLIKTGKLYIVDLAGSENMYKSGAQGIQQFEASNINKSLLTLTKVIQSLAYNRGHIPYRESKLTRILRDSFGGKSRTCMIATFSPSPRFLDETLNTLEYAKVARCVSNTPQANEIVQQACLVKYYQEQVLKLERELLAARHGDGFYITTESYEQMIGDLDQEKQKTGEIKEKFIELKKELDYAKEREQIEKKLHENLAKSFKETADYNEKLKSINTTYINNIKCIPSRLKEIDFVTTKFYEALNYSEHTNNVISRKYDEQCTVSIANAETAKRMHTGFVTFSDQLQQRSEETCKRIDQQFENLSKYTCNGLIKHDLFQSFKETAARINNRKCAAKEKFRSATAEISKQIAVLLPKIQYVLSELQNTMQPTAVMDLKIRQIEEVCQHNSSQIDYVAHLLTEMCDLQQKLCTAREEYDESLNVCGTELCTLQNNFLDSIMKNLDVVNKHSETIRDISHSFNDFLTSELNNLRNSFEHLIENEVTYKAHVGDTPVKVHRNVFDLIKSYQKEISTVRGNIDGLLNIEEEENRNSSIDTQVNQ